MAPSKKQTPAKSATKQTLSKNTTKKSKTKTQVKTKPAQRKVTSNETNQTAVARTPGKLEFKIPNGLKNLYNYYVDFTRHFGHFFILVTRVWIGAHVFLRSGLLRLNNWEQTVYLFDFEYGIPILPPEVAAVTSTIFELVCGLAVAIGFMSKLFVLPLLAITAYIQFFVYDVAEHYSWMLMIGFIITYGSGKYSVDYLAHKYGKNVKYHY